MSIDGNKKPKSIQAIKTSAAEQDLKVMDYLECSTLENHGGPNDPFFRVLISTNRDNRATAKNTFLFALPGTYVKAEEGSYVVALDGSIVEAWKGSVVRAYNGSKVIVQKEATVFADTGSKIILAAGAKYQKSHESSEPHVYSVSEQLQFFEKKLPKPSRDEMQ